jgi:O-antigen/teichoic acid export membrane protein
MKIAVNSGALVAGQVFGMVSGLISVAIAARYLGLDEYGQVIAAMVLVSMFSAAGDFGMSAVGARQLARDPTGEQRLAVSMLWAGTLFAALPVVLILAVSQLAYAGPEDAVSRTAVLILLSTFVLNPLRGVAQAFAIAEQRMYLVALAGVLGRITSVLLVALFAALDAGPLAIAAAYAAANVMADLATVVLLRGKLRFALRIDRREVRSLVAAAVPLGLVLVLVLNGLYFKLDAFLLAVLASEAELALYGVA